MRRLTDQEQAERLAARLLEEQGSPEKAVAVANLMAASTHGHGQQIWRMVAAHLSATEPKLQLAP